MKLAKLRTQKQCQLGRTTVAVPELLGYPVGSQFRLLPHPKQRIMRAEVVEKTEDLADDIATEESVADNRNLVDDPASQALTRDNIMELRDQGASGKEIVNTIVDNSTTFQGKTEYSKEKYVRKKQKKYFEFISVEEPTVRLVSRMYYMQDPLKILNLRLDSISQLLTACSVRAGGRYLLFESGCLAVTVAAVLERLGGAGNLVHVFNSGRPQRHAVEAINFTADQLAPLSCVNLASVTSRWPADAAVTSADPSVRTKAGEVSTEEAARDGAAVTSSRGGDVISKPSDDAATTADDVTTAATATTDTKDVASTDASGVAPTTASDIATPSTGDDTASAVTAPSTGDDTASAVTAVSTGDDTASAVTAPSAEPATADVANLPSGTAAANGSESARGDAEAAPADRKRRRSGEQTETPRKKSKYCRTMTEDAALSLSLLSERSLDGLLICCRQHPLNLVQYLSDFLAPSRPFAVFCPYKEPLLECYFAMKAKGYIMLRVTETWLRQYQVLPERTHPEINMSGGGGYVLSGYKVDRTLFKGGTD